MNQIRLDLSGFQGGELGAGRDPRVEGFVMLQAQGFLEVKVAEQDQREDRLARQVESQQQSDFFECSGGILADSS